MYIHRTLAIAGVASFVLLLAQTAVHAQAERYLPPIDGRYSPTLDDRYQSNVDSRYLPPAGAGRWMLGVSVRNVANGVVITRVVPASVAAQAGLEAGDMIVSVSGSPVGVINGRLYDLENAINSNADYYGRVTLRVRSVRDGRLVSVPVRLAPADDPYDPGPVPYPPVRPRPPGPGPGPFPPRPGELERTIEGLYRQYLGRAADRAGLNGWIAQVRRGQPLGEVKVGLLASSEFYDRSGNNPNDFVRALAVILTGAEPSRQQQNEWRVRLARERNNRANFVRTMLQETGQY